MKKKWLALILAGVMAFSLMGCSSSGEDSTDSEDTEAAEEEDTEEAVEEETDTELTEITFVLDWTPNTNHTGLYVAQELGYFEEAGLSVEIVQPPEDGAEVLVASGSAQFGITSQQTLAMALTGDDQMPLIGVAAVLQHNTSGIISRAGEGMDTPSGLEGHSYATWDEEVEKSILRQVVEDDGGDFSLVELIPSTVTDEVSALESNSVDAIWVYYGWAGIACELAGLETDYFYFKDINEIFDYYTPIIISNSEWLEENGETAEAFLAAVQKGYEYAIDNPEEAAAILLEAAPELDEELVYASQEYMVDQYIAEADSWGYIDADRWNAFYEWLWENELIETEIAADTGFTNEYLSLE